ILDSQVEVLDSQIEVLDSQVEVFDNQGPDNQVSNSQIARFKENYQQELEYFINRPHNQ
ncbi:18594_t:CDS:1, partial [Dentiscutata erythropus]